MSPKDKDTTTKKSSVIYWFICDRIDCEDGYIKESSRTFEEWCKDQFLNSRTILATQHLWKTSNS